MQLIQNYRGRVGATDTASHNPNYRGNFAASYVTGSHAFKAGMDMNGATRWADTSSVVPYSYVVSTLANNGVGLGIPVPHHASLRSDGCTDPLFARSMVVWSEGTRRFSLIVRRRRRTRSAARAASTCRTNGRSIA